MLLSVSGANIAEHEMSGIPKDTGPVLVQGVDDNKPFLLQVNGT